MSDSSVPRRAELILDALGADTYLREVVIGDLAEEFALRVKWDGPVAARRWYYRESLRAVPYLLRDWWRGLRRNDVGSLAGVLALSSMSLIALEYVLQLMVKRTLGVPLEILARSAEAGSVVLAALMLSWTLVDGAFAGYVAARLGRRAPLPSALSLGVAWMGLMILAQGHAVPLWFRAANAATLMAGMCAGGVIRACRASARTVTTALE